MDEPIVLQICLAVISFFTLLSNSAFTYLKYKADKRFESLESTLKEKTEELSDSETKVKDLQRLVFQANFDKTTLEGRIESLEKQRSDLDAKLTRLEAHEEQCSKELAQMKARLGITS